MYLRIRSVSDLIQDLLNTESGMVAGCVDRPGSLHPIRRGVCGSQGVTPDTHIVGEWFWACVCISDIQPVVVSMVLPSRGGCMIHLGKYPCANHVFIEAGFMG
jgi:hypothetical protein